MHRHHHYRSEGAGREGQRDGKLHRTPLVATYFQQECPVCGRTLRIRVEHLGRGVVCRHCRCRFTALDETMSRKMRRLAESKVL
jgi:hypothetical protein